MSIKELPPEKDQLSRAEFPVANSVVDEVVFGKRETIMNGKVKRANCTFHAEILGKPGDLDDPERIMLFLRDENG